MNTHQEVNDKELYFLVLHLLKNGPFDHISNQLENALNTHHMLPVRYDPLGNEIQMSYDELKDRFSHISSDHLKRILTNLLQLANEKSPFPCNASTLLGQGGYSLLNGHQKEASSPLKHTPFNFNFGYSFPQSISTSRKVSVPANRYNHVHVNYMNTLCQIEIGGTVAYKHKIPLSRFSHTGLLKSIKGHSNASYCVIFDKSGDRIITGSDDRLIKVWSAKTGLLLATLRGHDGDIIQIAVDASNKILASSSNDHMIRLWSLVDYSPLAVLNDSHQEPVTELSFYYELNQLFLMTTALDGNIISWKLTNKEGYIEAEEILDLNLEFVKDTRNVPAGIKCASMSPGGTRVVTGHMDGRALVWSMNPLKIIQIIEGHNSEISCIAWSHSGGKFFTGSYDGSLRVYEMEKNSGWKCTQSINVSEGTRGSHRVLTAIWSLDDEYIIATITKAPHNTRLRVFSTSTGTLLHKLSMHTKEIHVLDNHPNDARIFVSSGYDGRVVYWDIRTGTPLSIFKAEEEDVAFYDGRFSPSGSQFVALDNCGTFWIFGHGNGKNFIAPSEQFFANDYAPIIRDSNGFVVDEATNTPPHLLPRTLLCNSFLHPYERQYKIPPYNPNTFTKSDYVYQAALRGCLWLEEMSSFCTYEPIEPVYPSPTEEPVNSGIFMYDNSSSNHVPRPRNALEDMAMDVMFVDEDEDYIEGGDEESDEDIDDLEDDINDTYLSDDDNYEDMDGPLTRNARRSLLSRPRRNGSNNNVSIGVVQFLRRTRRSRAISSGNRYSRNTTNRLISNRIQSRFNQSHTNNVRRSLRNLGRETVNYQEPRIPDNTELASIERRSQRSRPPSRPSSQRRNRTSERQESSSQDDDLEQTQTTLRRSSRRRSSPSNTISSDDWLRRSPRIIGRSTLESRNVNSTDNRRSMRNNRLRSALLGARRITRSVGRLIGEDSLENLHESPSNSSVEENESHSESEDINTNQDSEGENMDQSEIEEEMNSVHEEIPEEEFEDDHVSEESEDEDQNENGDENDEEYDDSYLRTTLTSRLRPRRSSTIIQRNIGSRRSPRNVSQRRNQEHSRNVIREFNLRRSSRR